MTPDLETVGRFDFGGRLRSPMTAHPKMDPVTGEMLFFGYDIMGPPWLRYHVVDASGNWCPARTSTSAGRSMVHDFAITEHHVVFLDLPVVFDLDLLGQRPFPAAWQPEYGRGSASCPAMAATPTCAGSTSSSATSSTR